MLVREHIYISMDRFFEKRPPIPVCETYLDGSQNIVCRNRLSLIFTGKVIRASCNVNDKDATRPGKSCGGILPDVRTGR